jgi:hypothetical protein
VPEVGLEPGSSPLNIRRSPEILRNPAQSGRHRTQSEAQGVHIVHTLSLPAFGAPDQAAYMAVRAGRLCLARDFTPIGRVGPLTRPRTSTAPGSGPHAEIDDKHADGFLLSQHLMEKRAAACMTTDSPVRHEANKHHQRTAQPAAASATTHIAELRPIRRGHSQPPSTSTRSLVQGVNKTGGSPDVKWRGFHSAIWRMVQSIRGSLTGHRMRSDSR